MATVVRTYFFCYNLKTQTQAERNAGRHSDVQMDVMTSEYNACIILSVVSVIFMLEGGKDDLSPN